jgi:hypothetical protein
MFIPTANAQAGTPSLLKINWNGATFAQCRAIDLRRWQATLREATVIG